MCQPGRPGPIAVSQKVSFGLAAFHSAKSRAESTAVRLALLNEHYREDWEWRDELLSQAQSRLATWRTTLTGRACTVIDDVRAALDDDLDSPGALVALDEAAQGGYNVAPGAALLGITL